MGCLKMSEFSFSLSGFAICHLERGSKKRGRIDRGLPQIACYLPKQATKTLQNLKRVTFSNQRQKHCMIFNFLQTDDNRVWRFWCI